MASFFKTMLNFAKNEPNQYLYLIPGEDNLAMWEILDQEELERRIKQNMLEDGCRLFRIDQEYKVRFERMTHIE